MARLTLNDAKATAARGRPWTFRMEDASGNWWYATGRGLHEAVEVVCGDAQGNLTAGSNTLTDVGLLDKVCHNLVQRGYTYVDTQYIRMSPANLAQFVTPAVPAVATQTVRITPKGFFNGIMAITQAQAQVLIRGGAAVAWI